MGMIEVDVSQIAAWQARIDALSATARTEFLESTCTELGNRLIALVVPRTPVDHGELRGGWNNANGSPTSSGGSCSLEIINPVEYASYVEYGHRQEPGRYVPAIGKRLVASWVNGKFFLQQSEEDLRSIAPGVVNGRLNALLRTVF